MEDIIFYELILKENIFIEKYINRLEPDHQCFRGVAMHTFNSYDGICVIDGQDYKRYRIARFIKKFL